MEKSRIELTCEAKVAFLTKDEAKRAKHTLSKVRGMKMSVYKCRNCKCWHFTSAKEED